MILVKILFYWFILQKLNKQLERGDVDAELLEQLGWTQQEMKQFADRLAKHLQESKKADEAPESKARQLQFEEMLKNLDLQKSGTQRAGEKEPKRGVSQIEAKRTPVPPIYRSAYEKFTRDQARLKKGAGKNWQAPWTSPWTERVLERIIQPAQGLGDSNEMIR